MSAEAETKAEARWRRLAARLGLAPAAAETQWRTLRAAYAEPKRAYHTLDHIQALLARAEDWAARIEDPDAFALAAWFHDLVYRGEPGRDERASAARLRAFAAANALDGASIDRAEAMILATVTHRPPDRSHDAALFLDADLEILSAAPEAYAAYARAIRREYAHAPDALFIAGRRAALRALLDRDRLYLAAPLADVWEAAARRNMRAEIAGLERGDLAEG